MPKPCNTCDRPDDNLRNVWFPILGTICGECVRKLSEPTHRENCVTTGPIVELCWQYVGEFHQRRESLLKQAREVCE